MSRRVVYNTAATLDGYIADAAGSLDWLFAVDNDMQPDIESFMDTTGALVSGSTTYEWVLEHEDLIAHPEKWSGYYGGRPWFVFTSRELPVPEGADVRFVNGTPEELIEAIGAAACDQQIWIFGGGDLVGQFFEAGLLAEVQVSVTPVVLGAGAPLFTTRIESDRLRLERVEHFGQFAHLTYSVT